MDEKEIKSLERRARALMASRAISPARMDVVHSLMQNESLAPGERYLAIIDLIKNNPEKKVKRTEKDSRIRNRRQQAPEACSDIKRGATREDVSDLYAPTESFRYIGDILRRYGHLKLFKIRYLVHRNNRFGIGFKKRIIPSKRLVKIFNDLWERQNAVADRLSRVMTDLLEDPSERSPQAFNYLRIISKWLLTAPLVKYRYDEIKWMERVHFEREFRSYAMKYFSIKKIDPLLKEALIEKVEERIRLHGDPGMAEGGKIGRAHV